MNDSKTPLVTPSPPRIVGVTRRGFLTRAAAASAAVAFPNVILPRPAWANVQPGDLRDVSRGQRGVTLTFDMRHGPFPCAGHSYDDPTTIIYIPYHFRVRDQAAEDQRIDVVVHFHGHRTTAGAAMRDHQLREQLLDSLQNAILVMPQGPVNASDSSGGKLDLEDGLLDFLTEVRKSVQLSEVAEAIPEVSIPQRSRIGLCLLSGHSGGYRVIARCLDRGGYNVNEVYLLDALYGELPTFQSWMEDRLEWEHSRERHKIVSFFQPNTDVARNNATLMANFRAADIPFVHETVSDPITRGQFTRYRSVFIEAAASHQGIAWTQNNLRDCLYSSCLDRYIETDWFSDTESERVIDTRQ